MATSQILNTIGLTLNLIGVIMLFKYGLPAEINKDGHISIILEQKNPIEQKRWGKYHRLSYIALILVIAGFIFQILATVMF